MGFNYVYAVLSAEYMFHPHRIWMVDGQIHAHANAHARTHTHKHTKVILIYKTTITSS